jgi:DNA-3-methyladenine glycosylase II
MHPPYWQEATSALAAADPIMARLITTYDGEMLQGRGDAFYTLARSIVGQQVSVKAADSIWAKLEALFCPSQAFYSPSPYPSPQGEGTRDESSPLGEDGERAQRVAGEGSLTPRAMLQQDEVALRACGLSRKKIAYLYEIAKFFIEHNADEAWFANLSDAELMRALVSIKGVGRWTAEMFMLFHLHRPDLLPLDDIGLQKALEMLYGLPRNPNKKLYYQQIEALAAPWQPWRSVATWYLWRALDPAPVAY